MKSFEIFDREFFKSFALLTHIGLTMALNIFAPVYLYHLFEKYFFKSLIFLIFMILLGIFNGFYSLYKIIFPKK